MVTERRQVPWKLGVLLDRTGADRTVWVEGGLEQKDIPGIVSVVHWVFLLTSSRLSPSSATAFKTFQPLLHRASSGRFYPWGQIICSLGISIAVENGCTSEHSLQMFLNGMAIPQCLLDIVSRTPEHNKVQRFSSPFCKMAVFAQNLHPLSCTLESFLG